MMKSPVAKDKLIAFAQSLGIQALGIAPWPLPIEATTILAESNPCPFTNGDLKDRLNGNSRIMAPKSIIVCLFPYYKKISISPLNERLQEQPNLARYTWSTDYHLVIPNYLEKIAIKLKDDYPDLEYEIHCDTSPLADRYVAYLAGLGFYGKNHCFIHPKLGSYTSIGSILINLELSPDQPMNQSCLGCNRCIVNCPGQALGHDRFQYETCKSYLTQKKGDLDEEEKSIIAKTPLIFGCDICQEVCPHNQKIPETPFPEFQNILPHLNTEDIKSLTNKEFKKEFGHKAFSWRGKNILLRNENIIKEGSL